MKTCFRRAAATAGCFVFLLTSALPSFACAPNFAEAFFSYSLHPDFPLTKFAKGELGVLQPSFARSYLVPAYRYMVGKPLNDAEQRACVALWTSRLLPTDSNAYGYNTLAVQAWLKARAKVTSKAVDEINTWRNISEEKESYSGFENCPTATFNNAIKELNDRIAKYGVKSDYVKEWVEGQDKVFCHCKSPVYNWTTKVRAPECAFPAVLPAGADAKLKADRAYQIAAAHFYAKMFDTAQVEFIAIAGDGESPWQKTGLFMAARCLIRKGTLADKVDTETLAKATDLLNQVLSDAKLDSLHAAARGLLSYIQCSRSPDKQVTALAGLVLDSANASSLQQNLCDYTFLLNGFLPDDSDDDSDKAKKPKAEPEVLSHDDLSDWLYTYETAGAKEHAVQRWQESRSLPWLLAALSKVHPADKEEPELIKAAQALAPTSPAYLTANYFAIQLLLKANQRDGAAQQLAKVMTAKMPPSAHNLFVNEQMLLAPTVDKFIALAAHKPVATFSDYTGSELPDDAQKLISAANFPPGSDSCYPQNAADILNRYVPLKILKEAALSSKADRDPRFDLAQAVWVRAVLLKQDAVALSLVPLLKSLDAKNGSYYDAYSGAKTPGDRRFAAFFFILRNPGARPYVTAGAKREVNYDFIEDYGNNWWDQKGETGDFSSNKENTDFKSEAKPQFLSDAQIAVAKSEVKSLQALGTAPDILAGEVLAYAQSHPADPRIAEALHRCVKASKFGSKGAKTGIYSKQAFSLLHKRYGGTAWAKKTPYYYSGD